MSSRGTEIRVGLAVLFSIVILIGGILWGKGVRLGLSRVPIKVSFNTVGGLEAGGNVLSNGVVVGRVTSIELSGGKVQVSAMVDRHVMLYADYRVLVESPTLMAGRVLSIYPGQQAPLMTDLMHLSGEEPFGVGEAMAIMQNMTDDFKLTLTELNKLLVNLNAITGDSSFQRNVVSTAKNAEEVSRQTAELLRANRAQLETTLDKLSSAISAAEKLTTTAASRVDTTFDAVDAAVQEITELAQSVRVVADKLQDNSTTMGRLLTDDELYTRLNTTLADVDSLVVSIRKNGLRNKIVLF